jgi:hypothetical protein
MKSSTKSIVLFLGGCIVVRALFVYFAKIASLSQLRFLGFLALFPAIGFLSVYNRRMTGPEVFGEPIWWNRLRPFHAFFYFAFAFFAISGSSFAWIFLAIDVVFGLGAFLNNHFLS